MENISYIKEVPVHNCEWEYFCDASYYNFWAVRPVGEQNRTFWFHIANKPEAINLVKLLSSK